MFGESTAPTLIGKIVSYGHQSAIGEDSATGNLAVRQQGRRAKAIQSSLAGVGKVAQQVPPLLEFSHLVVKFLKPLLVLPDNGQNDCLGSGRDLAPEFNRDRRNRRHTSILQPLE